MNRASRSEKLTVVHVKGIFSTTLLRLLWSTIDPMLLECLQYVREVEYKLLLPNSSYLDTILEEK